MRSIKLWWSGLTLAALFIACGWIGWNGIGSLTVEASSIVQSAYQIIQDHGTPLARRTNMNFTGAGVTVADMGGVTTIDVSGGSSSFGAPNTNCAFVTSTSVTCTHNLGTTAILVQCFNSASPPAQIDWDSLELTNSNSVTVTFSVSQSGSCKINGTQGSGQNVTPETMSFTVDDTMNVILCDATGGTVVAALPPIATAGLGRQYAMKKTDASANSCTFDGDMGETIDGSATRTNTTQFQSYTIITDGTTGWYII